MDAYRLYEEPVSLRDIEKWLALGSGALLLRRFKRLLEAGGIPRATTTA